MARAGGKVAEPVQPRSEPLIDRFVDALWLEDGLARKTLEAYRSDLNAWASWQATRRSTLATA
ncbi:MAG: site-specific integrase, partial [Burkholderiaceae bacterium]